MRYINKFPVKLIAAVFVGFVFAGALTTITYTCTPIDGASGCVSFDKAVMHPRDLISNKQESLTRFFIIFVATSLSVLGLLSVVWQGSNKKLNE